MQYVVKTVEVESSKTKQALSESQARNQHLQEQVAMQRQVLKEMEQQLQSSHQLTAQLRGQVGRPCGVHTGRGSQRPGLVHLVIHCPGAPQSHLLSLLLMAKSRFCPSLHFVIYNVI